MAEIKPLLRKCPFCGGKAELLKEYRDYCNHAFVQCKNCGARIQGVCVAEYHCANDVATEAWNRRADNDKS